MQDKERSRDRARPGIDADLAERLDRLSRADAERVLETAIRMQAQRHSSDTFTAEQVRHIARELGLEDTLVDRAIREELADPGVVEERSCGVLTRLRRPERVSGPAVTPIRPGDGATCSAWPTRSPAPSKTSSTESLTTTEI